MRDFLSWYHPRVLRTFMQCRRRDYQGTFPELVHDLHCIALSVNCYPGCGDSLLFWSEMFVAQTEFEGWAGVFDTMEEVLEVLE